MGKKDRKIDSIEKDLPIQSARDDLLNRDYFAMQLVKTLTGYTQKKENMDGLVIGIEGPWGSGKTSLLNLMKQHLKDEFIVKTFNAWLTSDRISLMTEFFRIITDFSEGKSAFNTSEVKKYGINVIKSIAQSVSLSVPPIIPGIIVNFSTGKLFENFLSEPSLMERKKNIISSIKKAENQPWMILFIDDLDRLSYDEIGTVFQLIKNIADFPKVIYILAYDHEIVTQALNQIQKNKGHEYLQKIVQIVYDVPMPESGNISAYLINRIEKIIGLGERYKFDKEHLYDLLQHGILGYLTTIRDCNRVLNAFYFKYLLCGNDCDVGDLLAITVLELFEPDVYTCIRDNRYLFLENVGNTIKMKQNEFKEYVFNDIDTIKIANINTCRDILIKMFPGPPVTKNVFNFSGIYEDPTGVPDKISFRECFERYFCLTLGATEVPINQLIIFLQMTDESKIYEQLELWSKHLQYEFVFEKLTILIMNNAVPEINTYIILHAVSRLYMNYPQCFFGIFHSKPMCQFSFIEALLRNCIFKRTEETLDFKELYKIFCDYSISVYILKYIFIRYILYRNGKLTDASLVKPQKSIPATAFFKLLNLFKHRLKLFIDDDTIYHNNVIKETVDLLLIWKLVDCKSYREYIQQDHSVAIYIFFLIEFMALQQDSNNQIQYVLKSDFKGDYNPDYLYKNAKKICDDKNFENLYPIEVQERVMAYICIYETIHQKNIDLYKVIVPKEMVIDLIKG